MEERNACRSQVSITRIKRIDRSKERTLSNRISDRQNVQVVRAKSVSDYRHTHLYLFVFFYS